MLSSRSYNALHDSWSHLLLLANAHCGWLAFIGALPLGAVLSLPSSAGQRCENMTKGSQGEIRREKSLTSCCNGQNRLDLEKLI